MSKFPLSKSALPSKQSGAALIVSLVILAVITVLGVANMQTAAIEMKMAVSTKDRSVALAAAESALINVEETLNFSRPKTADFLSDCSGATCYNKDCNNGLCFAGRYNPGDTPFDCQVVPDTAVAAPGDVWSDSSLDVWNTNGKHKEITVTGLDKKVKYILEFMCYVDSGTGQPFGKNTALNENPFNGSPLMRITALAEGNGGRASVMLQSTYLLSK